MITVITGGSGSGKSEYAESEVMKLGKRTRIYVATMKPWDMECRRRIERHRAMRAQKQFSTVECYRSLSQLSLSGFPAPRAVLLECMSNLVSNELFGIGEEDEECVLSEEMADRVVWKVTEGVNHLSRQTEDLVIVTNEVFSDGDSYDPSTNLYRRVLGNVNCRLGALADCVIEVAAGLPTIIKEGKEESNDVSGNETKETGNAI